MGVEQGRGGFFKGFHRQFHVLTVTAPANQGSRVGLHYDQIIYPNQHRLARARIDYNVVMCLNGERVRLQTVAFGIFGEFFVKRVEATEVAPTDVGRYHPHPAALLHHPIVDADVGDRHHIGQARLVGGIAWREFAGGALGGGVHVGTVLLEFAQKSTGGEAEHAAVPVIIAFTEIFGGRGCIRFFAEGAHFVAGCFDVAEAGFGIGGLDAEGDQVAVAGEGQGLFYRSPVGGFLFDEVVGGGDEHELVRIEQEAGEGDGWGGVATHGFEHEAAGLIAKLLLGEDVLVLVGHHHEVLAEGGVALQGEFEERLAVEQRVELLGAVFAGEGPEACAAAAGEDQVGDLHDDTKIAIYDFGRRDLGCWI